MNDRLHTVLAPFEKNRALLEDRVAPGIEQNRKGRAAVRVADASGRPVAGAKVRLSQKTHDFLHGANLFMLGECPDAEGNAAHEAFFADAFNLATLPFYWSDLEPERGRHRYTADSPRVYRRPAPDLCLEFCERHGIMPKAHCLNYACFFPAWLRGATAVEEKAALERRFRELAERYAGRIRDWEVTNETFWGLGHTPSAFYDQPDFVEWSFRAAERHFRLSNRLVINEAGSRIWDDTYFHGDRSPYYLQIERALLKGCRIDSIGMQFHMFFRREDEVGGTACYYDPARLYGVLDAYARLGLPVQITEMTIPAYGPGADDEQVQAEIIRRLYSILFSHPAMEGIVYWNLVDGFAYNAAPGDMSAGENYFRGGLIRHDFTPKPAYEVIRELFGKTWRTDVSGETDADGRFSFRGFFGEYDATVAFPDGRETTTRLRHVRAAAGRELEIRQ